MPDSSNGNGNGHALAVSPPAQTSTTAQSIVSSRKDCPLCNSRSRTYIDTVIIELRDAANTVVSPDEDNQAEVIDSAGEITYGKIETAVRQLLHKLGDDTQFEFTDLVIHAGEHTLISELSGMPIRSEGNYLVVGNAVYQKIDPKDALSFSIALGAQYLAQGKMKLTAAAWTNQMALLWRMLGNATGDEFIDAMIEKTKLANMEDSSPLGMAYSERKKKMESRGIPIDTTPKEADGKDTQ